MSSANIQRTEKVYTDSVPVDRNLDEVSLNGHDISFSPVDLIYNMNYLTKGYALVINNEVLSFGNACEISREEVHSMSDTLKMYGFKVITRNNLKVGDLRQIFNDVSKLDHSKCACFICIILTRGPQPGTIQCSDDTVSLTEFLPMFFPNKCPTLIDKPKLFFIQNANTLANSAHNSQLYSDYTIPMISLSEDFLISSCTVNSERRVGGFIEILSNSLKNFRKLELQYILMQVNNFIVSKSKNNGLRTFTNAPSILSTLTKKMTFS
ncbi:caspase-3 [Octopus bimaculoides]|uniref:Caspase family p20 domain-containing protein n=1 Tax=Octopus bimaculoides TaxID=37653 RepID=A0A0L8HT31_OCTBM|nr:caspase-3 [Octopus bimaculoides]XP_014769623.1 caspase-3 [Octopus bimaculoides]|eukprot:XP_014769622.1 PREDICTED: caspase-3-like [Octopus bimaculoides]